MVKTIKEKVGSFSQLDPEAFKTNTVWNELFVTAQRYNQAISANKSERKTIASLANDLITGQDDQLKRELSPATTDKPVLKSSDKSDRPLRVKGRLQYPGDIENHGREAFWIFLTTQAERCLGIFADRFRYFRGGLTEEELHADDSPVRTDAAAPSSYWIGHATCLISVPLQSASGEQKSFQVLTDPVEGDLSSILYPRRTKEGRHIEECPAIDVMLLSHNHYDHYSTKTVKKLLSLQPVMIVPEGDGEGLRRMGFKKVVEQNWGDTHGISFDSSGDRYTMDITAVPSHHWAGNGPFGTRSAFVGYIIQGYKDEEGTPKDIYFAGDTALLNDDHIQKLKDKFPNIAWMYQPGGPDEWRAKMKSTHQASADSLIMHTRLFLEQEWKKAHGDKEAFLASARKCKTILMHTAAYKLGTLHADDTAGSLARIFKALRNSDASEVKSYEQPALDELEEFATTSGLTRDELADLLEDTVYVPKIGSRIDFEKSKEDHTGRVML